MLFRFTLAAFLATIVGLNLDVAPSQTQSRVSLHAVAVPQVSLASRQAATEPEACHAIKETCVKSIDRRSVPELFGGVAASETTSSASASARSLSWSVASPFRVQQQVRESARSRNWSVVSPFPSPAASA